MGKNGRRGTCNDNEHTKMFTLDVADQPHSMMQDLVWKQGTYWASTHHEGDLLAGLRLPVDHEDAATEDEETHRQRCKDPHLHTKDGADVVCGEIADHTHYQHCGLRVHIFTKVFQRTEHKRLLTWPAYLAHQWTCWPHWRNAQRVKQGGAGQSAGWSCHLSACWGGTLTLSGLTRPPQRTGNPSHRCLDAAPETHLAGTWGTEATKVKGQKLLIY